MVTETNLQVSVPDPCDAPNIQIHLRLPPLAEGSSNTGGNTEPTEPFTGM